MEDSDTSWKQPCLLQAVLRTSKRKFDHLLAEQIALCDLSGREPTAGILSRAGALVAPQGSRGPQAFHHEGLALWLLDNKQG
jgi:hypothetical protein